MHLASVDYNIGGCNWNRIIYTRSSFYLLFVRCALYRLVEKNVKCCIATAHDTGMLKSYRMG